MNIEVPQEEAISLRLDAQSLRSMPLLIDDVGSFPLPDNLSRRMFDDWYVSIRAERYEEHAETEDARKKLGNVVMDSLKRKLDCGLDIASYPQHYDMYKQFLEPIHQAMERGTYLVESTKAVLPELQIIAADAKQLSEAYGNKVRLRVSITGPMELYLKEIGTSAYEDVLLMFAETVRRFAGNSVLNSKYVETAVVCLDEPSFGFQEISADRDMIIAALKKAFSFSGATKQVHLHSSSRIGDLLEVDGVDVVSFEFAASPRNIESVSKRMLDAADKWIRVGISRTDIDSIIAELLDRRITNPSAEQLVDNENAVRKRLAIAMEKYGDRMCFTGPDCGLGGWPSQGTAELVLKRTVAAVRAQKKT